MKKVILRAMATVAIVLVLLVAASFVVLSEHAGDCVQPTEVTEPLIYDKMTEDAAETADISGVSVYDEGGSGASGTDEPERNRPEELSEPPSPSDTKGLDAVDVIDADQIPVISWGDSVDGGSGDEQEGVPSKDDEESTSSEEVQWGPILTLD